MFQTTTNNNKLATPNYCVTEDRDGNPHLVRCSPPRGYPTVAAATAAELREIKEKERFHCDELRGRLNEVGDTKEHQGQALLYYEINALMDEIEKGRQEQEKVRGLSLEGRSL